MSPQRDTFPIHVLTSADYQNRQSKKLPRRPKAPKTSRKLAGRARGSEGDKTSPRLQSPTIKSAKVANCTKIRQVQDSSAKHSTPRKSGGSQNSAVVYDTWSLTEELDDDPGTYLLLGLLETSHFPLYYQYLQDLQLCLLDYLARFYASGYCQYEAVPPEYPDDLDALLDRSRRYTGNRRHLVTTYAWKIAKIIIITESRVVASRIQELESSPDPTSPPDHSPTPDYAMGYQPASEMGMDHSPPSIICTSRSTLYTWQSTPTTPLFTGRLSTLVLGCSRISNKLRCAVIWVRDS